MFKELLVKEGHDYDYNFDWVIMNERLIDQSVLALVDNGEDQESNPAILEQAEKVTEADNKFVNDNDEDDRTR